MLVERPKLMGFAEAPSRARRLVREGDTILSTVRPNRRSMFFISAPKTDWVVSTGFAVLRPKPDLIDPRYLYTCVFDRSFTNYLVSREKGAAYPAVLPEDISNAAIKLPPLPEQRAIACILGSLDDKIEANRRMNETLEAIARALFKSWFVDFDPVRAKAEGREPAGMDAETAALFPDSFEETELGEVPKGWEVKSFADTVEIIGGGTPKTSIDGYWNGDIPWFSVVDAPRESDVWVIDTEKKITLAGVENSSTRILPQGTTIISARGTVGRVALVGVPMAMNQSCYGLRGRADKKGFFTYFSTRAVVSNLLQKTHGSVFDTITRDTLKGVITVSPPSQFVREFEQSTAVLLERIRENNFEFHTLIALRDALLPKLISGTIRLKDVEPVVMRIS